MRRDPTRPGRRGRPTLAALGLGLALVLVFAVAACGGSPPDDGVASLGGDGAAPANDNGAGNASASKDPQQRALDFARCMREHGIDMPDPQVDDQGRVTVRVGPGQGGSRPDPGKLEAAQKACGRLMGGGDGPAQIDPEARDAMVAYARCMRGQGIDMPDPTGEGMLLRRGEGPDPESEEFKQADKACNHHLANIRPRAESGSRS
jgi:hypothetical protein